MFDLPQSHFVRARVLLLRQWRQLSRAQERACLALSNYRLALLEDECEFCLEAVDGFEWVSLAYDPPVPPSASTLGLIIPSASTDETDPACSSAHSDS